MIEIKSKMVRVFQGSYGKPWRRGLQKAYIDAAWTAVIKKYLEDDIDPMLETPPMRGFNKFDPEWWELARKACRLARWLMWRDKVLTPGRKRSFDRYEQRAEEGIVCPYGHVDPDAVEGANELDSLAAEVLG